MTISVTVTSRDSSVTQIKWHIKHYRRKQTLLRICQLLLSFLLLFCMIVSNKETMNKNYISSCSAMSNFIKFKVVSENINIDTFREQSNSLSLIPSRGVLAHSSISLISYENWIEAQNEDPSWADQTKKENFELLYVISKKRINRMNNQTNKLNNTVITHVNLAPNAHLNSSQSGSLNSSFILYLEL